MLRKIPFSLSEIATNRLYTIHLVAPKILFKRMRFNMGRSGHTTKFIDKLFYAMSNQKLKSEDLNNKHSKSLNSLGTSESAIQIMRSIETYIESGQFKKKFNSYYYLQKYSWLCLHTWILNYRMRQCESMSEIISSYLLKKKVLKLLEQYTRDQVYEYDQTFDRQIYEELKRRQEVIFWALDEYFVFDRKEKQLGQIIEEDFGLWPDHERIQQVSQKSQESKNELFEGLAKNESSSDYRWKKQQQMKDIGQYFLSKVSSILQIPYERIKKGNIEEWLKI